MWGSNISSFLKLGLNGKWSRIADKLTTTKPTWNGCNSSAYKSKILEVNGHDELMKYGGEDREMGERLINLGLVPRQIRHQAVLLHLDHARSYVSDEHLEYNQNVRNETVTSGRIWTENGIVKGGQNA